jgi:nitroimidazol reductase NimA-like FMN-containing flavoprotein (pyridoxamine 5'-phosphate oxidase superfamily)
MSIALKGPWSQEQVDEYLHATRIPLRLACIGADGFPRVVSLWYRYREGQIYCVSHRSSKLIAMLRENGRVGFEVGPNEPPYCGVRGQGLARLSVLGGGKELESMLERYLGGSDSELGRWLLSRSTHEMVISIDPVRLFSWDYRGRMSDVAPADRSPAE